MKAKGFERRRPAVTEKSQLYLVGGGIAGLSAAVFAIRDGHLPGKNIHIFEVLDVLGGALDGGVTPDKYYVTRGDRKFNLEVFQCLWDVLSAIPSLTDPNKTVKDEIFEYNKIHKKYAQSRLIDKNRNRDDVSTLGLSWGDRIKLVSLILTPEPEIENRRIDSWFAPAFFETNFWKVFSSMFAIEYWNDLVEVRRYMRRFIHGFHPILATGLHKRRDLLNFLFSDKVPYSRCTNHYLCGQHAAITRCLRK